MKTYLYRASNLKSTITFLASVMAEVNFWRPLKTVISCDLFIANNISLLQTGFLGVY